MTIKELSKKTPLQILAFFTAYKIAHTPRRRCLWCGKKFKIVSGAGRAKKKFCCDSHRIRHFEKRHPGYMKKYYLAPKEKPPKKEAKPTNQEKE